MVVNIAEIRASGVEAFKLNNTALKTIRDAHEEPRGFPTKHSVVLYGRDETKEGQYCLVDKDPYDILTHKKLEN